MHGALAYAQAVHLNYYSFSRIQTPCEKRKKVGFINYYHLTSITIYFSKRRASESEKKFSACCVVFFMFCAIKQKKRNEKEGKSGAKVE